MTYDESTLAALTKDAAEIKSRYPVEGGARFAMRARRAARGAYARRLDQPRG